MLYFQHMKEYEAVLFVLIASAAFFSSVKNKQTNPTTIPHLVLPAVPCYDF